ncbi:forespore regulator of the sigma-K checkpoint [Paenibacillus forsythiae]|uniref:Forespore regulator of the sigma-K checkpoint n=1 Tax=Paenibacillus forsythiae TaxID=365616 RepID=A0ABU3H767_9BACL|nr:BofC C-terminal domain-containing protein [Paenibacillus forsythiae]MDT3426670.1 forespore regulator of the sigma-K checkpoint [Paenibacillus forsythiae]
MSAFRLKKQLWRRWRRWKKALWVGTACSVLGICAWFGLRMSEDNISRLLTGSMSAAEQTFAELNGRISGDNTLVRGQASAVFEQKGQEEQALEQGGADTNSLIRVIANSGISRKVHYKITYVSGEEIHDVPRAMSPEKLKTLIAEHSDWRGKIGPDGDVWLERNVNDLSPSCKKEAYIGLDNEGNLTLFKGPPKQEEALKTFFQIDIGTMKSALPEKVWSQLQGGIRVQDIDEYNSVLSTFSDYARDNAEAM